MSLVDLTKSFLAKTFDIREGEYQRVLLMQLNIFLIIFTLLIIKPVVNAQFISVIGIEKLPLVFVLVAISAMAISTLYSRALSSKSLQRVTTSTLIISIASLIVIGLLLTFGISVNIVLYVLYIGVAIFGVLTTSQFWIMANLAFDAREAKRLFSFIGAGPIAGGVAGGYLTSVVANYIEGVNLLFLAAALLTICIPLNNIIWKKYIKPLNTLQKKKRLTDFGDHPIWLIRKSKHLTYLALIVGLSVLVSKLVEFQFSSVAAAAYPDPADLTSFFGFWFSTFNVVSLLIQLFLTRKIVGTFGVGSSLFALPGGILIGSLLLLFAPVLWAGVFTKLWEVSVKQSLNKSATELLALPIPVAIKSQTKSFIDVFVDLAATGAAGLLLIFLVNGLELSIRSVSILTLGIIACWLWVAFKVRGEYINSFKSILTQADKTALNELPDFANISVINGLKKALESGTTDQKSYVLDKVREIPDKRLFDNVFVLLHHESPVVRTKALQAIYYLEHIVDLSVLEHLLTDPDQEVRYKAFAQLLRQNTENRILTIHKYLTHADPLISGAALVGIAEECRNNAEMKKSLNIEGRIREKTEYLRLSNDPKEQYLYKVMILRAAGHANLEAFYPTIMEGLSDLDIRIVKEAIQSAGFTMNVLFVSDIASFLVNKELRSTAQGGMLQYGVGIIQELVELSKNSQTKAEVVHQLPAVLELIDSAISVETLLSFLKIGDVALRLEALRSLNTIQRTFPHLKIRKDDIINHILEESNLYKYTLGILYKQMQLLPKESANEVADARRKLTEILERRLDGTLERIFRLIGLRYPPEDVINLYQGIKSVNENTRMNAVEFLDNLLEPILRKSLVPIAETAAFETISRETIESLHVKILDERKCFMLLLEGRDAKLKLAVFELILAAQMNSCIDLIEPFLQSPNERLRERAKLLVERIK